MIGDSSNNPVNKYLIKGTNRLFSNKLALPSHPLKILMQTLLNGEISNDFPFRQVDYINIPEEKIFAGVKFAIFGESECVGSILLAKLVDSKSMKKQVDQMRILRELLGNPSAKQKTDNFEAVFVETILVQCCLSAVVGCSHFGQMEVNVEAVIRGSTFSDCLTIFIRRILEEAHMAEISPSILSSNIRIYGADKTYQELNISAMKGKRQQILAILKAAVLNEEDICLILYMKVSTSNVTYGTTEINSTQSYFVPVRRHYRLTYSSEDSNVQCFSSSPMESISLGIFRNLEEAQYFLNIFSLFCKRLKGDADADRLVETTKAAKKTSSKSAKTTDTEDKDAISAANEPKLLRMLDRVACNLCDIISNSWEQGQITRGCEYMMVLHCILSGKRKQLTYAMNQLKCITTMETLSKLVTLQGILKDLRGSMELFLSQTTHHAAIYNLLNGVSLSAEEQVMASKYQTIYNCFASTINLIKELLLNFLRENNKFSEIDVLSSYLATLLWQLFDSERKIDPLLKSNITFNVKTFSALQHNIHYVLPLLYQLETALQAIELTIAMEIVMTIVSADITSYQMLSEHTINNDEEEEEGKPRVPVLRALTDVPRCFIDQLGYVLSRCAHSSAAKRGVGRVIAANELKWSSLAISDSLRYQLLGDTRTHTESADRKEFILDQEGYLTACSHAWNIYAVTGEYQFTRLGAYDFQASMSEEMQRREAPPCIVQEATKLKYLLETSLYSAVREAYYLLQLPPLRLQPLMMKFNINLTRFPSKFMLFNDSTSAAVDEWLAAYLFAPVRDNLLKQLTLGNSDTLQGPSHLPISDLPSSIARIIAGGIFGSDRILSALGIDYESIFMRLWNMPPILPAAPVSTMNVKVKVCAGITFDSITQWVLPSLHRYRPVVKTSAANPGLSDSATSAAEKVDAMTAEPQPNSLMRRIFGASSKSNKKGKTAAPSSAPAAVPLPEAEEDDPLTDLDRGILTYSDAIDLEVVYHMTYDSAEHAGDCRKMFAYQVQRCVRHYIESTDFDLSRVIIHREPDVTRNKGFAAKELTARIFNYDELVVNNNSHDALFHVMESLLIKYGSTVVEMNMLLPEMEECLDKVALMKIFESEICGTGFGANGAARTDIPAVDSIPLATDGVDTEGGNAAAAAAVSETVSHFALPKKDSIKGKASDYILQHKLKKEGKGDVLPDHSQYTDKGGGAGGGDIDGFELDDELGSSNVDPTENDLDRICATSKLSQRIQSALQHRSKCYVPCRIRFTLLASHVPPILWGQGLRKNKSVYSPILGYQSLPLTIGSDATVARLMMSTLYVAPESAKVVWQHGKEGIANATFYECTERWCGYNQCVEAQKYVQAYKHLTALASLTQHYDLLPLSVRLHNGLPVKLQQMMGSYRVLRTAMKNLCGNPSNRVDMGALGLTISRYCALLLRQLMLSPQNIHLRGCIVFMLKSVKKLEKLLQLTAIPMKCAVTALPRGMLDYEGVTAEEGDADDIVVGRNTATASTAVKGSKKDKKSKKGSKSGATAVPGPAAPPPLPLEASVQALNQQRYGNAVYISDMELDREYLLAIRQNYEATSLQNTATVAAASSTDVMGSGTMGAVSGSKSRPKSGKRKNNGELMFRKALHSFEVRTEALEIANSILNLCEALLVATSKDLHANIRSLHEMIAPAMPAMKSAADIIDLLLGEDGSFAAIASFVRRAETPANKALEDPEFPINVTNPTGNHKYHKILSAAVSKIGLIDKLRKASEEAATSEQTTMKHLLKAAIKSEKGLESIGITPEHSTNTLRLGMKAVSAFLSNSNSSSVNSLLQERGPAKPLTSYDKLQTFFKVQSGAILNESQSNLSLLSDGGGGGGSVMGGIAMTEGGSLNVSQTSSRISMRTVMSSTMAVNRLLRLSASAPVLAEDEEGRDSFESIKLLKDGDVYVPKILLSKYREEEGQGQSLVLSEEGGGEGEDSVGDVSLLFREKREGMPEEIGVAAGGFSVSGFKLEAVAEKQVARTGSMLGYLRSYRDHPPTLDTSMDGKISADELLRPKLDMSFLREPAAKEEEMLYETASRSTLLAFRQVKRPERIESSDI